MFRIIPQKNKVAAEINCDLNKLTEAETCFEKFKGEDLITVERNGLMLSTLRKNL